MVLLTAEGKSHKDFAATLGIAAKTVENHRAAVTKKLDLDGLTALVRYAIRNHVITP